MTGDPRPPVLRDKMMPPEWYDSLDDGIRFPVKVLHSNGFETCQSCQGGAGHAYPYPSVDLLGSAREVPGFAAMHYLEAYGLEVSSVAEVWNVSQGRVHEVVWRVELRKAWPERADEWPMFVWGYRSHSGCPICGRRAEAHYSERYLAQRTHDHDWKRSGLDSWRCDGCGATRTAIV